MNEIISVYVPTKLCKRIDFLRGDVPRSRYILRILEEAHKKIKSDSIVQRTFEDCSNGKK